MRHEDLNRKFSYAGAPCHGEIVPPLEEDTNVYQAPFNPPPLMDGDIWSSLIKLDQASTIQAHDMTTQDNKELVPDPHQQVTTMPSRLRDFT